MSHDFRTPMNAITGFNLLIDKHADDPDKVREYTHKVSLASQNLLSLLNDVLDMSKIESGKMTKDLALITDMENPTVCNSRDFILTIRERLEK